MFELLEKLRAKPTREKKLVAFTSASLVAGVMLMLWALVWFPDFRFTQNQEANAASAGPSPWSTFSGALATGFSEIQGQIGNLKQMAGDFTNTLKYTASSTQDGEQTAEKPSQKMMEGNGTTDDENTIDSMSGTASSSVIY